jgi:hypothetical protein
VIACQLCALDRGEGRPTTMIQPARKSGGDASEIPTLREGCRQHLAAVHRIVDPARVDGLMDRWGVPR